MADDEPIDNLADLLRCLYGLQRAHLAHDADRDKGDKQWWELEDELREQAQMCATLIWHAYERIGAPFYTETEPDDPSAGMIVFQLREGGGFRLAIVSDPDLADLYPDAVPADRYTPHGELL